MENFCDIPESLLLGILEQLNPLDVVSCGKTCKSWRAISLNNLLWKRLFYKYFKIYSSNKPGTAEWKKEFKRLYSSVPMVQLIDPYIYDKSENISILRHRDQVLHISFSHSGQMFASCSKDGFIKVWDMSSFPYISLKYSFDLKFYNWKYTQYSQFNANDTLLLVSGVHFGAHSTSGEIAVFNLIDGQFTLQCRVINRPYDIFGTWYNEDYLISGNLHWFGHLLSCSSLWINKAWQETDSELEAVVMRTFKFFNVNGSSLRNIFICDCLDDTSNDHEGTTEQKPSTSHAQEGSSNGKNKISAKSQIQLNSDYNTVSDNSFFPTSSHHFHQISKNALLAKNSEIKNNQENSSNIYLNNCENIINPYTNNNCSNSTENLTKNHNVSLTPPNSSSNSSTITDSEQSDSPQNHSPQISLVNKRKNTQTNTFDRGGEKNLQEDNSVYKDKYLVFTTGSKTYAPHQIGIKRIKPILLPSVPHMCEKRLQSHCDGNHEFSNSITLSELVQSSHAGNFEPQPQGQQQRDLILPSNVPSNLTSTSGPNSTSVRQYEEPNHNNTINNIIYRGARLLPNDEMFQNYPEHMDFDNVDHLIEMHGHIIGMAFSPDQRYLYVNVRGWPEGCIISNPLKAPPVAKEIEIRVIDMLTLKLLEDKIFTSHKAYTANEDCFFLFLDVCDNYVASGAEDKKAYIWDRWYDNLCVARLSHPAIVNCVAFNPRNNQILITASDDHFIRVWVSRSLNRAIYRCQEDD